MASGAGRGGRRRIRAFPDALAMAKASMPQESKLSFCLIYNGYYNSNRDVEEHFHDNTELIFIRNGGCSVCGRGIEPLVCHAGSVCVVPAGLWHSQREGTSDLYTDFLVFSGMSSLNSFRQIDVSRDSVIAHWFADIQQLSRENMTDAMQTLTNLLVLRLQSHIENGIEITRYPQSLLRAVEFIEQNYNTPLTVSEIIRNAYVSRTVLRQLFRFFFKMSVSQYLTDVRMYHARQLLCMNPYCNIREIAHLAGYPDADYFCRKFRKHHDMTPLEYRKYPTHFDSRHNNMKHPFRPLFLQRDGE